MLKRKFRNNSKRIHDAWAQLSATEDVPSFLNMTSYCAESILQANINDPEIDDEMFLWNFVLQMVRVIKAFVSFFYNTCIYWPVFSFLCIIDIGLQQEEEQEEEVEHNTVHTFNTHRTVIITCILILSSPAVTVRCMLDRRKESLFPGLQALVICVVYATKFRKLETQDDEDDPSCRCPSCRTAIVKSPLTIFL